MSTTTMTTDEIEARIAELEATPRALVGSDEGTHGKPRTYRVWEEITGERYATTSFGGANGTRCTVEEAQEGTTGRLRHFGSAEREVRQLARELANLRKQLRNAGR